MAGQQNNPLSPIGGVKAFACRNCGGQIELRAPGQTLAAVCSHCKAVTDLSDDNFKIITQYYSELIWEPVIPLGKRGVLAGVEWEVIGFMVRNAVGFEFYWEEYLLFNPYHGFRFLVHNARHWSLVEPLIEHPQVTPGSVYLDFEGQKYKRFVAGQAKVMFVLGEFYWKVEYGDTAQTIDYVAPPYMLSGEVEAGGVVWTRGVYYPHEAIRNVFALEQPLPVGTGVGMNQPNPYKANSKLLLIIAIAATLLSFVLQFSIQGKGEEIFATDVVRTSANDTLVSPIFVVPGEVGNVEVLARAGGLSNSWVEIDGYLHNVETLENYGVSFGFEYYAGYTDGESWSEGSDNNDVFVNEVPGGRYELVLNVAGENTVPVRVSVRRNVPFFSNLFLLLGLIWVIPAYYLIRSATFESTRWKEAD